MFREKRNQRKKKISQTGRIKQMLKTDWLKQLLGQEIASRVKSGEIIGLGSGTTSEAAIRAIGARIKAGEIKDISGVATSKKLAALAESLGFRILDLELAARLNWGFDGADEAEKNTWRLIKGGC